MVNLDLDEETITKEYVEKKVMDWKNRVYDVYATIQQWMDGTEYRFVIPKELEMYEYYMYKFKVPPTKIRGIKMYKESSLVMAIYPKGLWVIRTNGMIDILTQKGKYHLIDFANDFEEPKWEIFKGYEVKGILFNKNSFLKILEEIYGNNERVGNELPTVK